MSDSIIEQIAVKIAALVDAVTVGNGFHQTLTAVRPKRIHLEGDINTDLTVIVEQDAEAVIEEDSNTVVIWRQGFALQALVIDSDDATAAIDTRLNQVRSDIEKKLMTGDNWQLDGMGEVLLKSAEKFIADPQVAGISVNIDVLYEVNKADPYSQA
jgi:hypothetical protein